MLTLQLKYTHLNKSYNKTACLFYLDSFKVYEGVDGQVADLPVRSVHPDPVLGPPRRYAERPRRVCQQRGQGHRRERRPAVVPLLPWLQLRYWCKSCVEKILSFEL